MIVTSSGYIHGIHKPSLYNKGNNDVFQYSPLRNLQHNQGATIFHMHSLFIPITFQYIILVSIKAHATCVYINAAVDCSCSVTCWQTAWLHNHVNFCWWTASLLSCSNFWNFSFLICYLWCYWHITFSRNFTLLLCFFNIFLSLPLFLLFPFSFFFL